MPVTLGWKEIAMRLAMTVLAGLVIGFNRGEQGRPAGMRTTLLVCLTASLSMIQANLLMNSIGKTHDSFVVLDLMRLPLGVLSGMGFIGAGTILRKGSLVIGITTAATLWFVTLLGLCFGGGQIGLGTAALVLGCGILWGLKYVEGSLRQHMHGLLTITMTEGGPTDTELRDQITKSDCTIGSWGIKYYKTPHRREICCELRWQPPAGDTSPPPIIISLQNHPAVSAISWEPEGSSKDVEPQQEKPQGTPIPISIAD